MATSLIICLLINLAWATSIPGAHSVSLERLARDKCHFIRRFASKTGMISLHFKHQTSVRDPKLVPEADMRASIFVLDSHGADVYTAGQAGKDSLLMDRLKGIARRRIDIVINKDNQQIQEVAEEHSNLNGHHYFYICDHEKEVESYISTRKTSMLHTIMDMAPMGGSLGVAPVVAAKMITGIGVAELSYTLELHGYHDSGKTHLTVEEQFTMHICVLFFGANLLLAAFVGKKVYGYYKLNENVDLPLLLILGSILLQALGLFLKIVQCLLHGHYGWSLWILTLISLVWHMGADMIVSTVFVFMAKGWGIISKDILTNNDFEFAIGFFIFLGRYVWTIVGFFLDFGTQDHYHIYDGMIGWFEILNTILFFFWFSYSVKRSEMFAQPKYLGLRSQLIVFASIHYLLKPILIALVNKFDREHRHHFALIFSFGAHWLVCLLAGVTFTQKAGQYMRISIANGIELVTTGKGA